MMTVIDYWHWHFLIVYKGTFTLGLGASYHAEGGLFPLQLLQAQLWQHSDLVYIRHHAERQWLQLSWIFGLVGDCRFCSHTTLSHCRFIAHARQQLIFSETAGGKGSTQFNSHVHVGYPCLCQRMSKLSCQITSLLTAPGPKRCVLCLNTVRSTQTSQKECNFLVRCASAQEK